jgi:hypothetical protein
MDGNSCQGNEIHDDGLETDMARADAVIAFYNLAHAQMIEGFLWSSNQFDALSAVIMLPCRIPLRSTCSAWRFGEVAS